MAVERPYRRTIRQFSDGSYGRPEYILHPKYSLDAAHYVRGANIIIKDVVSLFEYIEPSEVNIKSYSFRTHELLIRTCIEIEANFKAILSENSYSKRNNLSIRDYKKIEDSHFLSSYSVQLPIWREGPWEFKPFENWTCAGKPEWYQAYNAAKHDRHVAFSEANFGNLLGAVAGLVVLISSQFKNENYSKSNSFIIIGDLRDGFEDSSGKLFRIKYPDNIPVKLRYAFSWEALDGDSDPFQDFPFT